MADESFMTVAEIAAALRCSRATVMRAIASGRLGAVPVGDRTVRVLEAEFERFIGKSRSDGADAAGGVAGSDQDLARAG
jgi:excisionase family DNA binding protein